MCFKRNYWNLTTCQMQYSHFLTFHFALLLVRSTNSRGKYQSFFDVFVWPITFLYFSSLLFHYMQSSIQYSSLSTVLEERSRWVDGWSQWEPFVLQPVLFPTSDTDAQGALVCMRHTWLSTDSNLNPSSAILDDQSPFTPILTLL